MMRVDYRIGSRQLLPLLRRAGVRAVTSHQMRFGDFMFEGYGPMGETTIGIERKTIHEVIGGLTSPEFKRQIRGMLTTYKIAWLIIEGYYKQDPTSGALVLSGGREGGFTRQRWLWDTIEKFVTGMTAQTPLRIKTTMGMAGTVAQLKVLYDYYRVPWEKHSSMLSVDESVIREAILSEQTVKRSVFAQLPGVYFVRSQAAAEHFGSIWDGMTAGASEWSKVKGIGPKTAVGVVKAIRTKG